MPHLNGRRLAEQAARFRASLVAQFMSTVTHRLPGRSRTHELGH